MAGKYYTLICDDVPNDVLLVDPGASPLGVAAARLVHRGRTRVLVVAAVRCR